MLAHTTISIAVAALLQLPNSMLAITAEEIVDRSAQVVHSDWERAPEYDYCATASSAGGLTTTAVLMLEGSPYYRLVARNGVPLSEADEQSEQSKYEITHRERRIEGPEQRARRVANYEVERHRNQLLLEEFTRAMTFELAGTAQLLGRDTYVVRGKPRPGYKPASKETKVLTGMLGTIWVDRETFHWVRVEAEVTRPVAIAGFFATVDPGTKFELEQAPVNHELWLASHFSMKTSARVFFLFHRRTMKDEQYSNYQPAGSLAPVSCAGIHE